MNDRLANSLTSVHLRRFSNVAVCLERSRPSLTNYNATEGSGGNRSQKDHVISFSQSRKTRTFVAQNVTSFIDPSNIRFELHLSKKLHHS